MGHSHDVIEQSVIDRLNIRTYQNEHDSTREEEDEPLPLDP